MNSNPNCGDVGILAIEIYFPNQYVEQSELEEHDGVSKGKYTIGLGQQKMGFCNDREDIHSLCLTVVQRLLEKNKIGYGEIGRLEVGTETIIDKSKSVKTVLMQLFKPSGNTDIEGIDTTNACYGGTPDLSSEFPTVDGKISIECYLSALDCCYERYCKKENRPDVSFDDFDYFCFHSPYCKLVQKSFARLCVNDYFLHSDKEQSDSKYPDLVPFKNLNLKETYFNRELEQAAVKCSKTLFEAKTLPSLMVASMVGNMYTPSLYGGLVSLLVSKNAESLLGKRIGMFSYGSGLASSMFSLQVSKDAGRVEPLLASLRDIPSRLEARTALPPAEFTAILKAKEDSYNKAPYQPTASLDTLTSGTYYLIEVDSQYRRTYGRRP
ncbi:hypothetical protein GHT06_018876 [Daphnia sinensis]|uniref:Hydroxymethylglutaryl-CoA synthase n=1 Tax=Daphnia sinensis TaxID=1820382 RepID=A0AAD5KN53_9CRUS|nr:hypothetical protein GHT06_018876 [Daphnia sinensis]